MQIKKTVEIGFPLAPVWAALCDMHLVAACLPGASIIEDLGDSRYKGGLRVKVGPLAASFVGDVRIETHPKEHAATVTGRGADPKSSSRASGSLFYRLAEIGPATTRIDVESEINLAGALAQFAKAAVVQEIANRITAQFVANLQTHLTALAAETEPEAVETPIRATTAGTSAGSRSTAARSLDAGKLVWSIIWSRITTLFRRLLGHPAGG